MEQYFHSYCSKVLYTSFCEHECVYWGRVHTGNVIVVIRDKGIHIRQGQNVPRCN